jgi:hypothetical protein
VRERLAADRLGNPEDFVAILLDLLGELGALWRSHRVEEEPYSNFSNIHDSTSNSLAEFEQARAVAP